MLGNKLARDLCIYMSSRDVFAIDTDKAPLYKHVNYTQFPVEEGSGEFAPSAQQSLLEIIRKERISSVVVVKMIDFMVLSPRGTKFENTSTGNKSTREKVCRQALPARRHSGPAA